MRPDVGPSLPLTSIHQELCIRTPYAHLPRVSNHGPISANSRQRGCARGHHRARVRARTGREHVGGRYAGGARPPRKHPSARLLCACASAARGAGAYRGAARARGAGAVCRGRRISDAMFVIWGGKLPTKTTNRCGPPMQAHLPPFFQKKKRRRDSR